MDGRQDALLQACAPATPNTRAGASSPSSSKPVHNPQYVPSPLSVFALTSHPYPHPLSPALAAAMSEKVDAPTSSDASLAKGGDPSQGPKAIIKNVDMSEDMQQEAVDVAHAALEKYNIEKDIAAQIKKEFDKRHGPTWHVVVGKNFGSYVTHGELSFLRVVGGGASWGRGGAEWVLGAWIGVLTARARRNEALHLLLHRHPRHPHLEVIERSLRWSVAGGPQSCTSTLR